MNMAMSFGSDLSLDSSPHTTGNGPHVNFAEQTTSAMRFNVRAEDASMRSNYSTPRNGDGEDGTFFVDDEL